MKSFQLCLTVHIKPKFWVLQSDVSLFENGGLAKISVQQCAIQPQSLAVLQYSMNLQEKVTNQQFSLSGLTSPPKSWLGLPFLGM